MSTFILVGQCIRVYRQNCVRHISSLGDRVGTSLFIGRKIWLSNEGLEGLLNKVTIDPQSINFEIVSNSE
mgnify:CR=1 FL=1